MYERRLASNPSYNHVLESFEKTPLQVENGNPSIDVIIIDDWERIRSILSVFRINLGEYEWTIFSLLILFSFYIRELSDIYVSENAMKWFSAKKPTFCGGKKTFFQGSLYFAEIRLSLSSLEWINRDKGGSVVTIMNSNIGKTIRYRCCAPAA